jgi:hypothetical protein
MKISYHKNVNYRFKNAVFAPLKIFNEEIRSLARSNGHDSNTIVGITEDISYTFLHFSNGDRIDILG